MRHPSKDSSWENFRWRLFYENIDVTSSMIEPIKWTRLLSLHHQLLQYIGSHLENKVCFKGKGLLRSLRILARFKFVPFFLLGYDYLFIRFRRIICFEISLRLEIFFDYSFPYLGFLNYFRVLRLILGL